MEKYQKSKMALALLMIGMPVAYGPAAIAATPVNLADQNPAILQTMLPGASLMSAKGALQVKELSRAMDRNQTLHVRIQETYSGYPIWGADAVVHIPQGKKVGNSLTKTFSAAASNGYMNGTIYQNVQADLANTPETVFTPAQANAAIEQGLKIYGKKAPIEASDVSDKNATLMIFVDKNNKAHWAYKVGFSVAPTPTNQTPAKPVYIMDGLTFEVYAEWNEVKHLGDDNPPAVTEGGGFGGNIKMGKLAYEGIKDGLDNLKISRDDTTNTCTLQNEDVVVKRYKSNEVLSFACKEKEANHNNLYWDGELGAVNDGYSPGNDALFGGNVIKDMYLKWYDVPVLVNRDGSPMKLVMVVHVPRYDNAYWDGSKMTFGDGASYFYPLTSLGVAAHEVSHGFTEQHSGLVYHYQSGGMNESFSDMAAQAAEFYAYGKNSWEIGPEIFKQANQALRYMDKPSKDCHGRKPGNSCSIDSADQYTDWLDVHYSSGVYNRMFYLLGSAEGWTPKQAFEVMVHANRYYWTSNSTFDEGACGIISSTKDLGYEEEAVLNAIKKVGVKVNQCLHHNVNVNVKA